MDKDEKYILDELAYAAGRPTWFEISGNLAIKLQEMMTRKDAEIERLREALECVVAYWNEWRDAPDNHATALSLEEVVNIVCAALKEKE